MAIILGIYFCVLYLTFGFDKYEACSEGQVRSLGDLPLRSPSVHSDYFDGGSDELLDDSNVASQWYSALDNGKQYIMVDSSTEPDQEYCSTYYPVYLRATHPPLASLSPAPVSVVACKKDYFYPCDVTYKVSIRRCGNEVQYYLGPTEAYNAYCFKESKDTVETPQSTTSPTPTTSSTPTPTTSSTTTPKTSSTPTPTTSSTTTPITSSTPTPTMSSTPTPKTSSTPTPITSSTTTLITSSTPTPTTSSTPTPTMSSTTTPTTSSTTKSTMSLTGIPITSSTVTPTMSSTSLTDKTISASTTIKAENNIIIIMAACLGALGLIIIGLIVAIMYRRRRARADDTKADTQTKDNTDVYDSPVFVKDDNLQYEELKNRKHLNQIDYATLTNVTLNNGNAYDLAKDVQDNSRDKLNLYEVLGDRDRANPSIDYAFISPYENSQQVNLERDDDDNPYFTLP